MSIFNPNTIKQTKYYFFTGKGGVGKTSIACATAITFADAGKKVFLISTDPASNLQDVFHMELDNKGVVIPTVPNLTVANLDPVKAAAEYRESVVAPYRGILPESVIHNMEEQMSGSCTVEIAAFNEFTGFITDTRIQAEYDVVLFDTAPTGHTLRMLQLPSAWSTFISNNTHGASCLGQLSGLESKKAVYQNAVRTLADATETTIVLVARPEETPLREAERASIELAELQINNQLLILNGVMSSYDDSVSEHFYQKQQVAISQMPSGLVPLSQYTVPLRAYNVTGIDHIRSLFQKDIIELEKDPNHLEITYPGITTVIDDLLHSDKKVIFTMGKGGVGKSTIASVIAMGLASNGKKVHLATTDPAAHLKYIMNENDLISISHIDEEVELRKYRDEVLGKVNDTLQEEDLAYIEEDLRSPCTQEIAVFRAFAELVERAENETVVIDTAPTGHTLLLLDSTQSYHKEMERSQGDIPDSVKKLLPRIRNNEETAVVIVTLAEATPIFEAMRLEEDLQRADIPVKWWVINSSFYQTHTTNQLLGAKAKNELEWIQKVDTHTDGHFALVGWRKEELKGSALNNLL